MRILILNGSPHPDGNTSLMADAFAKGAQENGHLVYAVNVCRKRIAGCMACGYCRQKGSGHERQCIQEDDMQEVYPVLDEADMIVLASPVYYHGFSGQLQCAINRIYALDKPKKLRKAALILSSGSDYVYGGAIYEYRNSFLDYLHLDDMGIFTAHEEDGGSPVKTGKLYEFGRSLLPEPEPPADMALEDFLKAFTCGESIRQESPAMAYAGWLSQEAMRIAAELNCAYHTPEEIQGLFSELIGKKVDEGFCLFPPFYTDCGKNITVGRNVFINSGCRFQDQGGITIGDDCLIGHNAVLATLNHGRSPENRHDLFPAPIEIGRNVWLGANVTVLPGVSIGDNAIVAADAVVARDVPSNAIVAGVPAKIVRML